MNLALKELEALPIAERVQVVEDLWDSIAQSNEAVPLPQWQKDELDRRKQNYLQTPHLAKSWGEVKQDILRTS